MKKGLQNPGRRVFLAIGGLIIAGYYFSKKSGKGHADKELPSVKQAAPHNLDAVTVDSTQVKIGASEF